MAQKEHAANKSDDSTHACIMSLNEDTESLKQASKSVIIVPPEKHSQIHILT